MRFLSSSLLLMLLFAESARAEYISRLADCNAPIPQLSSYTVLDKGRNTLSGWNHIQVDKPNGEYRALKLSDADYAISPDYYVADKSCAFAKVQNAILVVKLSDWTRQHSNGFETIVDNKELTFADVGYVLLDLKVNSVGTAIDDIKTLRHRYDDYLTDEEFAKFDQGKVNLGITLFEEGALDQASESLNVELFLSIDQNLYFDQWLRVIAPISDFNAYMEKDYIRTVTNLSTHQAKNIKGFRISPENSHGMQLRNFLGANWSEHLPETFKEMSISFRRIELLKRR